jgi:hypothetical protein
MTSCAACRDYERALGKHLSRQQLMIHNAVRLRRACLRNADAASRVVRSAAAWFRAMMARPADLRSNPILAPVYDEAGSISSCLEFEVTAPPRVDDAGRFRLALAPASPAGENGVVVSVEDEDRRLELCAGPATPSDPGNPGELMIAVDVSFLEVPAGRLDTSALCLTVVSDKALREWDHPSLLQLLRRILDCYPEPVEFFDAVWAALVEEGEDWQQRLTKEVAASPVVSLPSIQQARTFVERFADLWATSNRERHPVADQVGEALRTIEGMTFRYKAKEFDPANQAHTKRTRTPKLEPEKES